MSRVILGLGGLLRDPACCVIRNGQIASAVEQAKVSRQDRLGSFPDEAFTVALKSASVKPEEIDCIAIALPFSPGQESSMMLDLRRRFPRSEIVVVEHHHAHASSAYYLSPFDSAAVLTVDRAGDYRSAVLFAGAGNQLRRVRELYLPDSLGDVYNRVTELLGYEPRADEHKVQWLSAFGQPVYLDVFRRLLHRDKPEWPNIDRAYFDAERMADGGFGAHFYTALGLTTGEPFAASTKADIARSLQAAIEESITDMVGDADAICVAGGLALNAMLVRALEIRFKNAFVQPVAGNAGTALGAALYAWHNLYRESVRIPFETLCLGPHYSAEEIKRVLENCKLRFQFLLTEGDLVARAIHALNENKIVAWMQGRMEFGPRALGNRSILASPLNQYSSENLNVYIKHRESFRKFAASVPEEVAGNYFEVGSNARWLATVCRVKADQLRIFEGALLGEDLIRVHTVSKSQNPLYHSLLHAAGEATGLPILYNTSFNLFGDPLVCTPRDAVRSFYSSGIDALFVGNFCLEK